MATEEDSKKDNAVSMELPAPAGWVKKVIPKKGGTPHRNDIFFISPTGEEIKTKRQLEQYLKSHPGGPVPSEFDWGTGDTPRRSVRLSEKSKAVETSALQSPMKKQKRSSTKRGANEKSKANEAEGEVSVEKDATGEETKEHDDIPITDSKDIAEGEAVADQTLPENPDAENAEKKATTEPQNGTNTDNTNSNVKESNDEAVDLAADAKIEESEMTPEVIPGTKASESKETVSETPRMQNDESEDGSHTENNREKETQVKTIDIAEPAVAALDQNSSEEKQVGETPNKEDPVFEEPATGS